MISPRAVKEFMEIWAEEIGTEKSEQDAVENATSLLMLFDVVYRPIKRSDLNDANVLDVTVR